MSAEVNAPAPEQESLRANTPSLISYLQHFLSTISEVSYGLRDE